MLHFDEARSREPAEDFVREVLVDGAAARGSWWSGADFHFGRGRGGDVALLERMGAELGFEVLGVGLEAAPGGTIYSSTRIRELLAEGDVDGAAALLGRPHEVRGTVVEGDRRGRELGFPTANVAVPGRVCLPADGIYAGTFVGADGVERIDRHLARAAPDVLRGRPTRRCSRPTCSTSTATSTASRPRCASTSGSGARRGSTRVEALVDQMARRRRREHPARSSA